MSRTVTVTKPWLSVWAAVLLAGSWGEANAAGIPFSLPWQPGDLIVNMNGNDVTAARADNAGFENAAPSVASTILTKGSFNSGFVAQRSPNALSDLFITAPGDNDGSLYRVSAADGSAELLNGSVGSGNLGIASDGQSLFIADGNGAIDQYDYDGELVADNLITGVASGGFGGTSQLHYDGGYLFIAAGGPEVQAAPVSGGVATTILDNGVFGFLFDDIPGVWAGGGRLFVADSGTGYVTGFDLDTSGATPTLSGFVDEGRETGSGGFLGGLAVDLAARQIYAGSSGSFGSGVPGKVLAFDLDGNVELHDDDVLLRNVIVGLPTGGMVNPFLITIPEPTSCGLAATAGLAVLRGYRRRKPGK